MLKYLSPESPLYIKWKKVSVGNRDSTYDLVYVNGFDLQQDCINFVMIKFVRFISFSGDNVVI